MSTEVVVVYVRAPNVEIEMSPEALAEHRAKARQLMMYWLRSGLRLEPHVIDALGIEIAEAGSGLQFTFTKAEIDPLWVPQCAGGEWPAHDDLRSKTSEFKKYKNGGTFSPVLAALSDVAGQVMWHVAEQTACKAALAARERDAVRDGRRSPCAAHAEHQEIKP